MERKVHLHGLRVSVIKDWDAERYVDKKNFADNLIEDQQIRGFIKKELFLAGIVKIEVERSAEGVKLDTHTAKPGIVVGKSGSGIRRLKASSEDIIAEKNVLINIVEVKNVETNAQLMAEDIAAQLGKRISFRRAMKQTIQRATKAGTLGAKTVRSRRLGGAEVARTEQYNEGTIPLQTIRTDIDYGFVEVDTTCGKIGVKVWVCSGGVLPTKKIGEKEGVSA